MAYSAAHFLALIAHHFFVSREIILTVLMGITLVVLVHRRQIFAAGMPALFGIYLNTIGLEPMKYAECSTFDHHCPSSGVNPNVLALDIATLLFNVVVLGTVSEVKL